MGRHRELFKEELTKIFNKEDLTANEIHLGGNKIICEFLAAKVYSSININTKEIKLTDYTLQGDFVLKYRGLGLITGGFEDKMLLSNCKFHSSYDWLMPVPKKCHESWGDERFDIYSSLQNFYGEIDLWFSTVEFISWYNKNLTKEQKEHYLQNKIML